MNGAPRSRVFRAEYAVEVVYVGSAGHLRRFKVLDAFGRYVTGGLFRTEAEARAFIAQREENEKL